MKHRFSLLVAFVLLFFPGIVAPGQPRPLAIAAAGDLREVMDEVKAGFEARHPGIRIQVSFGASGSLTAQIQQGAPFDIFLSADRAFPEGLQQAGLGADDGVFGYATGCLVLWIRRDLGLDPGKEGLKVLLHPSVRKISTANPQAAPYGRAGEQALRGAGLHDALKPRLVFADNIAQAAQFLHVGAAEAGLISFSQANHPVLREAGLLWKVPVEAYPPLRQAGVILRRTSCLEQARAFKAFLLGREGQAILARHGFGRP